ncbi:MAG: hypothetical protein WDZ49_16755, partial [Litorilinea sp.]
MSEQPVRATGTLAPTLADSPNPPRAGGWFRQIVYQMRKHPIGAIGVIIVVLVLAVAAFAPLIAP